jgi:hypothetical protein
MKNLMLDTVLSLDLHRPLNPSEYLIEASQTASILL